MTQEERHLTDAELMRVADREDLTAAATSHLARCAECAGSVVTIRRESEQVSQWLRRAAFEATDAGGEAGRAGAPPWLKAAAILVLIAAPAALPGLRTWVAEQVLGPGDPTPAAPAVETVESMEERPTVIRFVPEPGILRVRVDAGPAALLVLQRGPAGAAELRLAGPRPQAMVSPASVRLRPRAGERYVLRLPAEVTGVRVEMEGRTLDVGRDRISAGTVVELPASDRPR